MSPTSVNNAFARERLSMLRASAVDADYSRRFAGLKTPCRTGITDRPSPARTVIAGGGSTELCQCASETMKHARGRR